MNLPYEFLVVDDDAISNLISELTIRRTWKEARVRLFTEPEKALDYIDDADIPWGSKVALFLDINMPTMTGWEFLERLGRKPISVTKNIKIFILSSSIDDRDRQKALSNPLVAGFLSKPLTTAVTSNLFE